MTLAETGAAYRSDLAVVRRMDRADAAWAASLHADALPHGFFARLGPRFLSAYYECFITSPYAVAYVADTTDGPAGMLVGTVRNRVHYSWVVRQKGRRLFRAAVAALLLRPPVLVFFLRTRLGWYTKTALRAGVRMFTHSSRPNMPPPRQPAVLAHVAVHDSARGAGAGSALVSAFVDAATSAGCEDAVLVTLAGPAGAGPFYRRLGWTLRDRHDDHDGRLLECYVRRL